MPNHAWLYSGGVAGVLLWVIDQPGNHVTKIGGNQQHSSRDSVFHALDPVQNGDLQVLRGLDPRVGLLQCLQLQPHHNEPGNGLNLERAFDMLLNQQLSHCRGVCCLHHPVYAHGADLSQLGRSAPTRLMGPFFSVQLPHHQHHGDLCRTLRHQSPSLLPTITIDLLHTLLDSLDCL